MSEETPNLEKDIADLSKLQPEKENKIRRMLEVFAQFQEPQAYEVFYQELKVALESENSKDLVLLESMVRRIHAMKSGSSSSNVTKKKLTPMKRVLIFTFLAIVFFYFLSYFK